MTDVAMTEKKFSGCPEPARFQGFNPANHDLPAIVRSAELARLLGLSKSAVYSAVKSGIFPAPIPIGKRAVGWRRADVMRLLEVGADVARPEFAGRASNPEANSGPESAESEGREAAGAMRHEPAEWQGPDSPAMTQPVAASIPDSPIPGRAEYSPAVPAANHETELGAPPDSRLAKSGLPDSVVASPAPNAERRGHDSGDTRVGEQAVKDRARARTRTDRATPHARGIPDAAPGAQGRHHETERGAPASRGRVWEEFCQMPADDENPPDIDPGEGFVWARVRVSKGKADGETRIGRAPESAV